MRLLSWLLTPQAQNENTDARGGKWGNSQADLPRRNEGDK